MIYKLLKKVFNKKAAAMSIILCFLGGSISSGIINQTYEKKINCYGFIVPIFNCENITLKEQIIGKTRHMINDFSRESIKVYWTAENKTVNVRDIHNIDFGYEFFFEKGTFIILFTGNDTADSKISAIIYDYNQSSEIEENTDIKIPIYLLMEPLNISMYLLSEVKIALFKTYLSSNIPEYFFLDIARKCGFLSFEIINEYDTRKGKLNNNLFNVVIWGWDSDVAPISWIFQDIFYNVSKSFRSFIEKGGGYIGCCAGGYRASCEAITNLTFISIKTNYTRQAYNPKLNCLGLLAISDVAVEQPRALLDEIKSEIVNDSHPVGFGLDSIVTDWVYGGAKFYRIGKNSEVVANFYNTDENISGTPSWVSSKFGKGRAVLFGTHPEFVESEFGHTGKTVHSNAIYYTTYKKLTMPTISISRELSFIINIWIKTANLIIGELGTVFTDIKNSINDTTNQIMNLINYSIELINQIDIVAHEKEIDPVKIGKQALSINLKVLERLNENFGYTIKTINIIEKIYYLLEENAEFILEIQELKNDLLTKINKTNEICDENIIRFQTYADLLSKYENQKLPMLSIFLVKRLYNTAISIKREISRAFYHVPQMYFNSLKLLRHYWYNYEAFICL